MSKSILSLVLVLAIAGVSSAATVMWNETVQVGDWEAASNWVSLTGTAIGLPGTGDFAGTYPRANGTPGTSYTAVTINVSTNQSVGRIKPQLNTATINVNGGTLLNNGTLGGIQMYNGAADTFNIASGARLDAKGATYGLVTGAGSHTININAGGIMGAYGTTTHLASQALWLGGTSAGGGVATVNVYGVLDADSVTIVNTNQLVKLYIGGVIYSVNPISGITAVGGPLTVEQILSDPTAGNNSGLAVYKYTVPEPATMALLGLGGLLLRRKK